MGKVSGIVSSVSVDDASGTPQDISDDVTQIQLGTPYNLQDVTGLDVAAIQRLTLLADATVALTGVADFSANMWNDVFKAEPAGPPANVRTVALSFANAAASLSMEMVSGGQSYNRGQDGSLTCTVTLSLADGTIPAWT